MSAGESGQASESVPQRFLDKLQDSLNAIRRVAPKVTRKRFVFDLTPPASTSLDGARALLLRGAKHEYQCPAYVRYRRRCTCRAGIKADALIAAAKAEAVKPLREAIKYLTAELVRAEARQLSGTKNG